MNKKIKYGIVGAGHLGNFHVQQLSKITGVEIVGVFDINPSSAKNVAKENNVKVNHSLNEMLDFVDAISICTPAINHFDIAKKALKKGCHLFIEKPIAHTVEEAKHIIQLNSERKKIIQVGHIERFNSAFTNYLNLTQSSPLFIEAHRLSPFNKRGLDVPVVLDLMIHDIDLVLSLVGSPVAQIHATGACIISDLIDLANARILFKSGAVANITASRISNKQMRKMRIFEKKSYSSLNFQTQECKRWIIKKDLDIKEPIIKSGSVNALYEELNSFVGCIKNNTKALVSEKEGLDALEVAVKIQKIIGKN